jgi:hypothetical protein
MEITVINFLQQYMYNLISFFYKHISTSNAIHFIGYIISTCTGGFITYQYNRFLHNRSSADKAYMNARLIQFQLTEEISLLADLKEQLNDRIKKLEELNKIGIEPYSADKSSLVIEVFQDFSPLGHIHTVDFDLTHDLCHQKLFSTNLEETLQLLTTSQKSFNRSINIREKFNETKEMFKNKEIEVEMLKDFLAKQMPRWVEEIKKTISKLKSTLNGFQKNICTPLNIKKITPSGQIEITDKLFEKYTPDVSK